MPNRITLPLSIIICVLIFGLTKYYSVQKEEKTTNKNNAEQSEKSPESSITNIVFSIMYIFLFAVLVHSSFIVTSGLFTDWEKITPIQALSLVAAIGFCFFLPGYALVAILNKKYKLSLLLKILLAYLFSMLIAGLEGYISGSFGNAISKTTIFFLGTYVLIFLFFLQQNNAFSERFYHIAPSSYRKSLSRVWKSLLKSYSAFIVFSSLFALVIFYTYYLNDGKIIIDHWYLHGRALLIGSELFKDLAPTDVWYPPYFSSLLAAFFNMSGSPSVNAYVMIGFLNIVPVFAFYYFFTNWIPKNKQKAAILCSTLFMLSAGFGWVYVTNLAAEYHNEVTFGVSSTLNIITQAYSKTFDIETPTTFINVGHPGPTTSLIIVALPAGFTLLGLVKEGKLFNFNNDYNDTTSRPKPRYSRILTISIVTAISFLGILSHDEFYLFILVASIAMVVLFRQLPINVNYSIFFVSFLCAITLVILTDTFVSPARFYTLRHIFGIPIIILTFLFVSINWSLYAVFRKNKISNMLDNHRLKRRIKIIKQQELVKRIATLNFLNDLQIRFLKLSFGIAIVLVVAYLYLFTLLVWETLSVNEISSQIKEFSNVPWYLFPMKFGLTGLLALAFILSYLFKKFEKEIFVFGIIIIIAFFAGPYYDEHRFGKYIMAGMAAFAALLIYQIISSHRMQLNSKLRPLIVGSLLGVVVTSSCLSIFMYAGWIGLYTAKNDWIEGGRRDFPTTTELRLLNFLNNKIIYSKAYNIAVPEKETTNEKGFVTKIYGFSPTSRVKLLQSPVTLNSSTLEGLYGLLNKTDVRFIILPKKDIIVEIEKEGIASLSNNSYNGNISNVMRFVLDNFPKAYEDQNYIILEVPPLIPPATENSTVSFVYQRDFTDMLPHVSDISSILPTDLGLLESKTRDDTRNNSGNYHRIIIKDNKEENKNSTSEYSLTLGDKVSKNDSKIFTLWDNTIQKIQQRNATNSSEINRTIINYIEANFRIIDELPALDKSEKKNVDKFGAGIVWNYGNNTYQASVSNVGLQLSQIVPKITPFTKQHAYVPGTEIGQAIKILLRAANVTTNATDEVITKVNKMLNLAASAGDNTTQIAIDQGKDIMTNKTGNVPSIASNTTGVVMAEANKIIRASKALNNDTNSSRTTITQSESVVTAPPKMPLLTKEPEQVNNADYTKQSLTNFILSQNEEVKRQKGVWYNLKILFLKNNVEIFLNDILRIKVPLKENYNISSGENSIINSISNVGITSYYSKSEFKPIMIGKIPNETDHSYIPYQKIYYQHYYPVSSLALSDTKYDAFMEGDLTAFSKKYVVLPYDKEPYQNNETSKYLEYVSKGGNLIVINSNNKYDGIFGKLLSIKPGNLTKYTDIETNNSNTISEENSLAVSGMTRSLEIFPNSNSTVKSYYTYKSNDNLSQIVAPFAIEKNYGKGKITYVNAIGYFDSIFGRISPDIDIPSNRTSNFATLSQVASLMGIPHDNLHVKKNTPQITSASTTRLIGDIRISSGQNVIINGSSLVFPNSNNNSSKTSVSYNLSADDVSVSTGNSRQISLTNYRLINNNITNQIISTDNSYYFKKALIKDLELFAGPFEIIINVTNSTRPMYLPTSLSYNDYVAMSIPKGFDMTVKFSTSNSTYAQFDMIKKNDKNSFQRIKVSGSSNGSDDGNDSTGTGQILFHNVKSDIKDIRYLTTLMKSPEIKIINENKGKGIANPVDEQSNSLEYRINSPDSTPIEIQKGIGDITMNIDHVDNYNENYLNWTRTKFITYLKNDIQVTDEDNNKIPQTKQKPLFTRLMSKMPGDISEFAKEHEIEVPWRKVIISTSSILIALGLLVILIVTLLISHKVIKLHRVK